MLLNTRPNKRSFSRSVTESFPGTRPEMVFCHEKGSYCPNMKPHSSEDSNDLIHANQIDEPCMLPAPLTEACTSAVYPTKPHNTEHTFASLIPAKRTYHSSRYTTKPILITPPHFVYNSSTQALPILENAQLR